MEQLIIQKEITMSYDLNRPFNIRHDGAMTDAVAASREEMELEALVDVVGGPAAQQAVQRHQLVAFLSEVAQG
jgi:hypothetical protein